MVRLLLNATLDDYIFYQFDFLLYDLIHEH